MFYNQAVFQGADGEFEVTVTPSVTEINVCDSLPNGQDWQPPILLTVEDVSVPTAGTNLVGMPTLEDTERCVEQRFSLFVGETTDALTVNVERLQTSVPDAPGAWEAFIGELETFGIKAEAFPQPGVSKQAAEAQKISLG